MNIQRARRSALAIGLTLGLALAGVAAAQSPTAGLMGQANVGDVALVENVDTGFRREVKVDKSGRYKLRNLPTGTFRVTVKHPDGSSDAPKVVTLRVGSTARVQ